MKRWFLGVLLLLAAGPSAAHKASDAYLTWQVDGSRIEQRIDIALRDLDRELALDADDDGQLTWGEVRSRWPDIERLADAGVRVKVAGEGCTIEHAAPAMLDEHTDGRYAVLQRTLHCAAVVHAIDVDYRLFIGSDATHRGIARVAAGAAGASTTLLVPGTEVRLAALSGDAAGRRSWAGFVAEGARHIASGFDHILFLVTLLMVAVWRRQGTGWVPRDSAVSAWRETLRLVSAFTVAHSLTLTLAAAGVLAPPSRWVESLIAASVLVAALDNLRPFVRGPRWLMVALFGLVHGFGFAGPLQDLGLAGGELALPLLGFNLGVELGQLIVVALLLPLASGLRHAPLYRVGVVRGGSLLVAGVATLWLVERSLDLALWR